MDVTDKERLKAQSAARRARRGKDKADTEAKTPVLCSMPKLRELPISQRASFHFKWMELCILSMQDRLKGVMGSLLRARISSFIVASMAAHCSR